MVSTQEKWRQPGTGAWWRGADEGLLCETKALHPLKKKGKKGKKMLRKPHKHESKEQGFEHIEPLAKVLHYFLRSNKSNINQKGQIG